MNHVDVSDSLAIGNRAGESGSFTLANSSIQDGVKIGQNAGYDDGSVNLIGNTIVAGGLTVDMWRNGGSGTVNIIDNTTLDGSVDVSSFINALGGTVNCSINTPRVDPLQCQ